MTTTVTKQLDAPSFRDFVDVDECSTSEHNYSTLLRLAAKAEIIRPDEKSDRPIVIVNTEESRVITQSIQVLSHHEKIFQRGGLLVHIVQNADPPQGIKRPKESSRIIPLPLPRLREALAEKADFSNETSDGQPDLVRVPEWVVKGIAARGEWAGIRRLESIVEAPVIRADGTILQEPGYDPETGLFFNSQKSFPPIPAGLSKPDAEQARDLLLEVAADFPFKTDAHKAAWLAATITPLARYAIDGPTPLFFIDGNCRGVGKSLLADAMGVIATGRPMPRMIVPREDDEVRKRITSLALAGEQIVLCDNVSGNFGSPALDAALTARTWSDRVLGSSEMASNLPLNAVWFATGNNVSLQADTARRICAIRLESPEEHPEERTGFRHPDLLAYIQTERPRFVAAALTILAAYWNAGMPDMGVKPWGSYEAWSSIIRSAVVWVGLADPGATRMELRTQADKESIAFDLFLDGWRELDPAGHGLTINQALRLLGAEPLGFEGLRSALLELAPSKDGRSINPRSLGMKLHHCRRRVIGGRYIDSKTIREGVVWSVHTVGEDCGSNGSSGSNSPLPRARAGAHAHTHANSEGAGNTTASTVTTACSHPDVEESETADGFMNRRCRVCNEWLPCRKNNSQGVF
jgi:hypothetical protein